MSKITETDYQEYSKLIEEGHSQRSACLILGLNRSTIQRYIKGILEDDVNDGGEALSNKPRILFYDIETTLAKSYHFGQWKQNIGVKQQVQEGHLLSHSWAWNDGDVIGSILTREEVLDHDPERLVLEAWALFDNADIIVAHYGKKFDIPKMNGYFLKYGLQPPSPFKVVDTKEISSKKFLLPFNSLEYLAKALGVQQKIDNSGIQLWID